MPILRRLIWAYSLKTFFAMHSLHSSHNKYLNLKCNAFYKEKKTRRGKRENAYTRPYCTAIRLVIIHILNALTFAVSRGSCLNKWHQPAVEISSKGLANVNAMKSTGMIAIFQQYDPSENFKNACWKIMKSSFVMYLYGDVILQKKKMHWRFLKLYMYMYKENEKVLILQSNNIM